MFYIKKLIKDFFTLKGFKLIDIIELEDLADVTSKNISHVFVSDVYIKDNRIKQIVELLPDEEFRLIITTPKPDEIEYTNEKIKIEFLKIPFKPENLNVFLTEE